jgi:hypothetical protein
MKTVLTLALIASLAAVSAVEAKNHPRRAKNPNGDPAMSAGAMKGGSAALLGGSAAPGARRGAPRRAGAASASSYSNLGETTLLPGAGGGRRPARRPKRSPY